MFECDEFQFTHPGRGATQILSLIVMLGTVSIHAPREGCDVKVSSKPTTAQGFNSRTPGGVRLVLISFEYITPEFQFTHPGRGATAIAPFRLVAILFQFTHPGRGATLIGMAFIARCRFQFTHPGRGATLEVQLMQANVEFQFTHPGRGATSSA